MLKLLKVYQFEVPRVAGPHGGRPGFNPWSKQEIIEAIPDINVDGGLDELLDLLKEKSQLLVIPEYDDNPTRYLTKTAEMVRTIGTIHEYVARETDDDEDRIKSTFANYRGYKVGSNSYGEASESGAY